MNCNVYQPSSTLEQIAKTSGQNSAPVVNVAQYYLPLTSEANLPDRLKRIDFSQFQADLNGKKIVGLSIPASDTNMSTFTVNGTAITLLSRDQCGQFTISFFDAKKNTYSHSNMPLGLFINSVYGTATKIPYRQLSVIPDMAKSYIEINSVSWYVPGTPYYMAFNFYYL
jgi:hypothetical protein